MIFRFVFCLALASQAFAGSLNLTIRGKQQSIGYLPSPARTTRAVLFLPGDGGWRGLAVSIGQTISGWGYDVYGFDTKDYLESFSDNGTALSEAQVKGDLVVVTSWIRARGAQQVVLIGWSQGASMAAIGATHELAVCGVIALGLPESGVLAWNWKDALTVLAGREPDEPHFLTKPILTKVSAPFFMVHGSEDEYTTPSKTRDLYSAIPGPKRLVEIAGADHRFDGHRYELYRALKESFAWIIAQAP